MADIDLMSWIGSSGIGRIVGEPRWIDRDRWRRGRPGHSGIVAIHGTDTLTRLDDGYMLRHLDRRSSPTSAAARHLAHRCF